MSQEQIERGLLRDAWQEVATCLERARDAVDWAQGVLADAPIKRLDLADQLDELVDTLRRAANDATEFASKQ
jgi:hypothetical protein